MTEKKKSRQSGMTRDLWEILRRYPQIPKERITSFAACYYPIAMVEMAMTENTLEDFESVQLTILKMAGLGFTDPALIARTLCLTPDYITRVLDLLMDYGLLDQKYALTENGQKSINAGRKVMTVETAQTFQVDALNGYLLRLDQVISERSITDSAHTSLRTGILQFPSGISQAMLEKQLSGDRADAFVHHNRGVFHVNVKQIHSVSCSEMAYAKSYMLHLEGEPIPLLFAKRYDETQKEISQRFAFRPYSVASRELGRSLGLEEETPLSTPTANDYTQMLFSMMEADRQSQLISHEDVQQILELYMVREDGFTVRDGRIPTLILNRNAFTGLNKNLLQLLRQLGRWKFALLADSELQGRLLRVEADNEIFTLGRKLMIYTEMDHKLLDKYKTAPQQQAMVTALLNEFE